MQVRLFSYTKPAPEFADVCADDDVLGLVAYCARVSNPGNQANRETAGKLVKYLIKHKHWSPLEMCDATLEIDTTRDIAHQMIRHSSFRLQEFSQRYADANEMGFEFREARLQDPNNRQNSLANDDAGLAAEWQTRQAKVLDAAKEAYDWAISANIAKEQARAVLPEGMTRTRLYFKGSMRSWIHYIDLRSAHGTQGEHVAVARACAQAISAIFPVGEILDAAGA